MAESGQGGGEERREPFVSQGDRPEVRLDPDAPLSELRVRDLAAILGPMAGKNPNFEVGKTPLKDFFDKPFSEETKDFIKEIKIEKVEKPEKPEKVEKNKKFEKVEKNKKFEKIEKREIKDVKHEKLEIAEGGVDPTALPGPDPRLDQVIQAVMGMNEQVSQLADQVAELQRRMQS
jgi:hypothetical protein